MNYCDELSTEFGESSVSKKISMNDVRKCHGFQDISDKEAKEIIDSIYQLSIISININKNEFRPI